MNSVAGSRLTTVLQMLVILALLTSIVILFAAVGQLGHNRKQMALAGEVSQVLIELEQLLGAQSAAVPFSDEIARLIGYGDVQTNELLFEQGNGFFSREGRELKVAKTMLVQSWKSAKQTFAANTASLNNLAGGEQAVGSVATSPRWVAQLEKYAQLRETFDAVFVAISQDTLSSDLLAANAQMLATLKNIDFVLSNRDSLNPGAYNRLVEESLSSLQSQVAQLVSLTTIDTGGVLIGYETRQLLESFAMQAKQFTSVPVDDAPSRVAGAGQQQRHLASAIDSAESYRQLLDFASHQNRRAILFAIAALCLALICLLLSLWRNWRTQSAGDTANSQDLELLRTELTAIADGNLSVRASQQSGTTLNAIAQASNHTVEMLTGLVRVFRRAGNHLNELAGSQQFLAKQWIKSEIKRHEQLELLSRHLELQSQAIDQLQEIENTVVSAAGTGHKEIDDQYAAGSRLAIQQLALKVSACRDIAGFAGAVDEYSAVKNSNLTGEGLLRMRQRMHELTGSISAVRLAAEQARLQVLNTSLKMTAYAGSADIDDQSRLVEDIQNISNQLASSAAGAERMSAALADDLQQYAEAFTSDKHNLANHFDQLQQSVNECLEKSAADGLTTGAEASLDSALESDRKEMLATALDNVQQQHLVLQQLVAELNTGADTVSDGDAIQLLEQIAEIQKVSVSLARSAEMYGSSTSE